MGNHNEFAAQVVRHLPDMTDAERQAWIKNPRELAAALANVLKVMHVVDENTLTVPANLPLATRITWGKYDWANPNFKENNFPHDPTSVGEWEWKLVDLGISYSSEVAVTLLEVDGWIVGKIEHLLAFGAKYPDEQRKYPIIALGSFCSVYGNRVVPELWRDGRQGYTDRRNLNLSHWYCEWHESCRFLVVRKKKA